MTRRGRARRRRACATSNARTRPGTRRAQERRMRFDTLRHAFAAIVTLAAPSGCCGDAPTPTDLVEHIDTTLPSLTAEVEACRRDDLACEDLCRKILGVPT